MRTLNTIFKTALANQTGDKILRVLTWADATAYNAAPTVPEHTWFTTKFDIFSTEANVEIITANDYTVSDFTVFIIERGLKISGVEYTAKSGLFFVKTYNETFGLIKITGSSYPNIKISIAAGDGTYNAVITAFCTAIGKTAVFKNATDPWLAYQFLPTGKTLSLNKAELFENLLKQKYTIMVYEESPKNLVFYNLDSYPSSALNAIADNGTTLVAVATSGAAGGMTSTNGAAWTPETLPSFYNDVTYGNSLYVAVGASVCTTSTDGVTWTARTIGAVNWTSVTWSTSLSLFIAVSNNTAQYIATSTDGITWTTQTSAPSWVENTITNNSVQWTGICYSPTLNRFVRVGNPGTKCIAYSTDAVTWTYATHAELNDMSSVCWSPELAIFCAVSANGTNRVQTSTDGITWTAQAASQANSWRGVCWSPALSLFVAVSSDGTNRVMTSPNGVNWTNRTVGLSALFTVVWSPELAIFLTSANTGNTGYTSPDGITWTARSSFAGEALCWSRELSLFVCLQTNAAYSSPDGITWTSRTPPDSSYWFAVTWAKELNLFIAVSRGGKAATSLDGITWTLDSTITARTYRSIVWSSTILAVVPEEQFTETKTYAGYPSDAQSITGNSTLVAVGTNKAYTSTNGVLWTLRTIPLGIYKNVTFGNNLYVAVGASVCATSPDGITWTARTIPAGTYYGVTYGNSKFVAVGASVVATSTDGITWTARTPASLVTWQDVLYSTTLSKFVAVASTGASRVMYSADGITWTGTTANADFDLDYTDGPNSYLDRQQSTVHFLWRDEAAAQHTSGTLTDPQWNLGFLHSTASAPTTKEDPYYKIFLQKAPVRLDITDGDKIHFTPYWSIDPTQTIDAMMHISEHLDTNKSPAWYQDIKSIVLFNKSEGGALPATIERVAAYTPLVSTGFDGLLTPAVNNLQALAQAVDDLSIAGSTQEGIEDIIGAMVSGNTETGIAVTYDDAGGKLNFDAQTAGDARYALTAKGVTNGDTHDHLGGDGGTVAHTSLSSIGTNTHAQIDTQFATTIPATYAPIAKGVTNGDSHDHNGGDGAAIPAGGLSSKAVTLAKLSDASFLPGGRLTLTTGLPVTSADVTAATTIYYTPYIHDLITLWDGSNWTPVTFTEQTQALGTLTAARGYDVFGYLSAGALAIEILVWTSATVRATAITIQGGRYCKSGDKTRLYLGSFYTSSTTTTEDSLIQRYVWNIYNRIPRELEVVEGTSHNYNIATVRAWNNVQSAADFEWFLGLAMDTVLIAPYAQITRAALDGNPRSRFGLNSTTTEKGLVGIATATVVGRITGGGTEIVAPSLGYSYACILEFSTVGTAPGTTFESASMNGVVMA